MRVHLIGVCGTAMATLAALLQRRGHDVQGSDQHIYPPMSDFLRAEGIRMLDGFDPARVTRDLDLVVVGNAISRSNPELEAVLDLRIRYCSLPEAVREQFLWDAEPVVLAGTHGKTTTTALTAWLLTAGGLDPSLLVGGIARNFGDGGSSYRLGSGRHFVIEGDEYDSAYFDKTAKFLKYVPSVVVVGNAEFDHADIYADYAAVELAFQRLVNLVPRSGLLLLGADDPGAVALARFAVSPVETFGLSTEANWRASEISYDESFTAFTLHRGGVEFGQFRSPLLGLHNLRNALAAIAVGAWVGLKSAVLTHGLAEFGGIKRRLEVVGESRGVMVIDDFAHHPTAVRETLAALRSGYPSRRVWAVFEPRSASSCQRVFQDAYAEAFGAADEVVVAAVYRLSLPEAERLDAARLVRDLTARGQRARYLPDVPAIIDVIAAEARPTDLVLVMSNGDFDGIHVKLLAALA